MVTGLITAAFLGCWFAGWAVFWRDRRLSEEPGQAARSVSVIIPARNEERNLPTLLQSLHNGSIRPLEILVVDDGSTDKTADVALQNGARVLASQKLPEGWTGKNWACSQGAGVAQGELLLFLDADTRMTAQGLERAVRHLSGLGLSHAVSFLPHHCTQELYEQMSLFFNLLMAMGTEAFCWEKVFEAQPKLVGQSLILWKGDYLRSGGHASVKQRILENFYFSEHLREAGVCCSTFLGQGVIEMRMFPDGLGQLIESWTKAFHRGAQLTSRVPMLLIVAWVTACMSPPLMAVLGFPLLALAAYILVACQLSIFSRRIGRYWRLTASFYFIPLVFYQVVFFYAVLKSWKGGPASWRGRTVQS